MNLIILGKGWVAPPIKHKREEVPCPILESHNSRKKCKIHEGDSLPNPQFNKMVDEYYKTCFGGNFNMIRENEGENTKARVSQNTMEGSNAASVSFNGLEAEPDNLLIIQNLQHRPHIPWKIQLLMDNTKQLLLNFDSHLAACMSRS